MSSGLKYPQTIVDVLILIILEVLYEYDLTCVHIAGVN